MLVTICSQCIQLIPTLFFRTISRRGTRFGIVMQMCCVSQIILNVKIKTVTVERGELQNSLLARVNTAIIIHFLIQDNGFLFFIIGTFAQIGHYFVKCITLESYLKRASARIVVSIIHTPVVMTIIF